MEEPRGEPPGEQKEAESPTVDTDGIAPLPANLMQRSSAQNQEAEAHREFPKYMLHPFATFRSSWDVATLFLLFVAAVQMPVVECFEVAMWTRTGEPNGVMIFTMIVDFFFVVDIFLNFNTAVEVEHVEGREVHRRLLTDRRDIATEYLRTWFLVDFAAIVPLLLDIVALATPTNADNQRRRLDNDVNFVRYFKLLKSMRLVRALKVFKFLRMNRVLARLEYTFIMSQNYFQMLNFLVITLIFCHFFACAFYFVASQNRFQDDRCAERDASGSCVYYAHRKGDFRPATWIARHGMNGRSKVDHYIASFYWTVMIVTTVGLGDVAGASTAERCLSIVVMIVGAAIFTVGTSSMIHLRDQLQWKKRQFAQSMHQLNLYMDEHKISAGLRQEIREHAVAKAQRYTLTLTEEQRLLDGLTLELRSKLTLERNLHFLEQVNFLKDAAAPALLRAIAAKLHIAHFSPGDVVVRQGSEADAMFFLVRGAVEVLVSVGARQRRVALLSRNQFFGEGAMMAEPAKRNATIRAIMITEARTLSRADMFDAVRRSERDVLAALRTADLLKARKKSSRFPSLRRRRVEPAQTGDSAPPTPDEADATSNSLLVTMRRTLTSREDANQALFRRRTDSSEDAPQTGPTPPSSRTNTPRRTPRRPITSSISSTPRRTGRSARSHWNLLHPLPNLVSHACNDPGSQRGALTSEGADLRDNVSAGLDASGAGAVQAVDGRLRAQFEELRADQARFRKEVLSKLSAVATMLSQQGAPQGVA